MTPEELGQKIKQKYPAYQDIPDAELAQRILKKYPQYQAQISQPPPPAPASSSLRPPTPLTPEVPAPGAAVRPPKPPALEAPEYGVKQDIGAGLKGAASAVGEPIARFAKGVYKFPSQVVQAGVEGVVQLPSMAKRVTALPLRALQAGMTPEESAQLEPVLNEFEKLSPIAQVAEDRRGRRIAKLHAEGKTGEAAVEALAQGAGDFLAAWPVMYGITGAAFPGTAAAKGIGSALKFASKMAAYQGAISPGPLLERAKRALIGFVQAATPVVSRTMPTNATAIGMDILLNAGIDAGVNGQAIIESAKERAQAEKKPGNWWKYALVDAAKFIPADIISALGTRSAKYGNDAEKVLASLKAEPLEGIPEQPVKMELPGTDFTLGPTRPIIKPEVTRLPRPAPPVPPVLGLPAPEAAAPVRVRMPVAPVVGLPAVRPPAPEAPVLRVPASAARLPEVPQGARVAVPEVPPPARPVGAAPAKPAAGVGKVAPAKLSNKVESEPGYVYHATNADRLEEIANAGKLVTHRPNYGTDQSRWPDGGTEKRSYFSKRADVVWQFAPEEGKPVVVRTKQTPDMKKESTNDIFSRKPISVEKLEYLGEDNKWYPVKSLSTTPGTPLSRLPGAETGRQRGAIGAGAGGIGAPKEGPKPMVSKADISSPDQAIESHFQRTNVFQPVRAKAAEVIEKVKNEMRRRFIPRWHMPNTPEAAYAHDVVRTMPERRRYVIDNAVTDLSSIVNGPVGRPEKTLDSSALALLSRKVFLEDMVTEAGRGIEEANFAQRTKPAITPGELDVIRGRRIPEGTTQASLQQELDRVNTALGKYPTVQEAFGRREQLWNKVTEDLIERGVLPEEVRENKTYVRHFVLDYLDKVRASGATGRKLREPQRGYSKRRKGTSDYSTDYLNVELKALSDIYADNAVQDMAEGLAGHYDRTEYYKAEAKKLGVKPETLAAEDGLVPWQFKRGNVMYQAKTITEADIAKELGVNLEDLSKDMKIPLSAMREAMVLGGKRKGYLVPDWLAAQLDDLPVNHAPGYIFKFSKPATQFVKQWYLRTNPIRYNFRNAIGDAEKVNAAGRAGAFPRIPEAIKMLFQKDKYADQAAYQGALQNGAISSSLWSEMGEARGVKEFEHFKDVQDLSTFKKALKSVSWFGQGMQDISQFREDILRAAVYLDALKDVDAHLQTGAPIRHWAGERANVEALARTDKYRAAAKVSRETLGDYGDFTPWENDVLRNGVYPFYSWRKINTLFWPKVASEAVKEGAGAQVGKAAMGAAARAGAGAAMKWGFRVLGAYGLMYAWNHSTEENRKTEDSLPAHIRTRPHLIIGGQAISSPSALSDMLEWFQPDDQLSIIQLWERGRITTEQMFIEGMKNFAKGPVNKVYQDLTPFIKAPISVMGLRTFPSLFSAHPYAKSFSNKAVGETLLDLLGSDARRFLDASNGKRSLHEVLAYYFSGSAYQPMEPEELIRRLNEKLGKRAKEINPPLPGPRLGRPVRPKVVRPVLRRPVLRRRGEEEE